MKWFFVWSLVSLSLVPASQAYEGKIHCKTESRRIVDVTSEDADACAFELLVPNPTLACFTGSVAESATLLNRLRDGVFQGTDGQYARNAKPRNANEIAYVIVDEANELRERSTLKRCTRRFFRER